MTEHERVGRALDLCVALGAGWGALFAGALIYPMGGSGAQEIGIASIAVVLLGACIGAPVGIVLGMSTFVVVRPLPAGSRRPAALLCAASPPFAAAIGILLVSDQIVHGLLVIAVGLAAAASAWIAVDRLFVPDAPHQP